MRALFGPALLVFVSGCGTAGNLWGSYAGGFSGGPATVYGGTRADLLVLTHPAGVYQDIAADRPRAVVGTGGDITLAPQHNSALASAAELAWCLCLSAADLPLSFVGDTLTLPYTVALSVRGPQQTPGPAPTSSAKESQPQVPETPGPRSNPTGGGPPTNPHFASGRTP